MKKIQKPKFKKGDTVKVSIQGVEFITTITDFRFNGFTYMYSFENTEQRCGEMYLSNAESTPINNAKTADNG